MANKTRNTGNLVSGSNIFVDIVNDRVGIGSTQPTAKLNVSGIVSATAFRGDGSGLTGVSAVGTGVEVRNDGVAVGAAATIDFGTNLSVSAISSGIVTVSSAGITLDDLSVTTDPASGGGSLAYDRYTGQFTFAPSEQAGGIGVGGTWSVDNIGINTTKNVGIGTTAKDGYKLYVEGDARVTGILTVGPASITIDGINNEVTVGSGVTIYGNSGIVSATSLTVGGTLNGDASSLTGLTGASAATYGNATAVPQIVVDGNGRITGITNVLISGSGGGGTSIIIRDDGTLVGTAGTINFGEGLTSSTVVDDAVTITGITTSEVRTNTLVVSGVATATNRLDLKSDDSVPGRIDYYCEVTNAHFTRVQAAAHAEYSGNVTAILPTVDGDFIVGDTTSAISQDINTTGVITATSFTGSGSNLTNIVTSLTAGSGISIDQSTGAVTVTATGGVGSGLQSRTTVTGTTASIGVGATDNITVTAGRSYMLHKVGVSTAAWVRIYTDATNRTADASRLEVTDPDPGSGVIAEVVTTGISTTALMTPGVVGFNNDTPASTNVYLAVTNKGATTQTIDVTLHYLTLEA